MNIAPRREGVIQYCFKWCGRYGCECSRRCDFDLPSDAGSHDQPIREIPIIEKSYISMKQDEKIIHIRSLDEHDPNQLRELLQIVKTEPDNLVRAIARAKLEGRAIDIVENLLNMIECRKHDFDVIDKDVE